MWWEKKATYEKCAVIVKCRNIILCHNSFTNGTKFQTVKKEEKKKRKVTVIHAQVTQGNKSVVTGQEMCHHMYLPLPEVSFHSCE